MNCIFITVFGHPRYVDMFFILLESIKRSGTLDDNISMLVYTSPEYADKIKSNKLYDNKNIRIITSESKNIGSDFNSKKLACEARLDFFDLPVEQYKKVLYLDVDIVVKESLKPLIEECVENKLYVFPEFNIGRDSHGADLFKAEFKDGSFKKEKKAFCSGVMLFNNSNLFKDLFNIIRKDLARDDAPVFDTFDQPYIIYHTYKNVPYDNKSIKRYILNAAGESRKDGREEVLSYAERDELLFHFCGPTTGFLPKKIENMRLLLNKLKE